MENIQTQQPLNQTSPPPLAQPVQETVNTSYVAPSGSGNKSPLLLIVFVILIIAVLGLGFFMLYNKPQSNYQTPQQNPVKTQTVVPTSLPQPTTTASESEIDIDTNLDADIKDLDSTLNQL
ncbi:MAG: hypothetical protein A3F31_02135 [Candidatus Levybacteria bacterium RIFCSPHIGHO2_12_FULL_38_12]|nr:MAG: hypothetical protein A2770_03055 [Candidatus Levybacteria bacterium RIFCSPHIGHO2_01_FULL_38_12]OGH22784.1 MAG: hypothetical protein A3F31_02135 [Candidatus Levybacteria bacterium RIFCSPHIGHO2_12_FULL_38_12]OGH33995.1 MAG: hypothetical protein A3A47_00370 [Candidatus Levybacteria bacterium RIFCSPLOWO2_01_FULL_37_20]OGH44793.1 MAG: hypothetical protein A3J14_04590 [Candidatus Levybacteria bacterium RIFCSPLOWO2_02_FULL_37_18]OGH50431.1 MAG: hypothetical protein A3G13_00965 [Candidatus Levy